MADVIQFPEQPAPDDTPAPPFRPIGLGYVFEPAGAGVIFRADYLKRNRDEVHGLLTVESTAPGVPTHIHEASLNFSSMQTRGSLAKTLEERSRADFPWRDWVEQFCVSVCRKDREGEPMVPLSGYTQIARPPDHIAQLVPYGVSTWLYGEEGSCKGHIAIAAAVCVAAGQPFAGLKVRQTNAAYLDWEDSADEAQFRARIVCNGLGITVPRIVYRNCRRGGPLRNQVNTLAKLLDDEGIGFLVIDSVGLATGTSRDGASAEEGAIGLHDAINVLGRTALCIDHLSKAEARQTAGTAKAYGSIYKLALARQSWELRKDQEDGSAEAHIGLFWGKSNRGTKRSPIGMRLHWEDDGEKLVIKREDVRDVPVLAERLPLWQRIRHQLQRGTFATIASLAEDLDIPADRIRVELNRHKEVFMRQPDATEFWVLIEHRNDGP